MNDERKLPILSVAYVENSVFDRFIILDEQNNQQWTGSDFGERGVLYASRNAAIDEVHRILKQHFEGISPVTYVAPVFIEVFATDPVHIANVARYLSNATILHLATSTFGNGPGSSLVLPRIEWHRIKPLKKFPNA